MLSFKKIFSIMIILFSTMLIPTFVSAYDGLALYSTTISDRDRYNSSGERLSSVRAILRQDRANFYAFANRDAGDQGDGFFSSKANRSLFDSARIIVNPGLASAIINGGSVLVTVYVLDRDQIEVVSGPMPQGVD